jgi:hypothetical protein
MKEEQVNAQSDAQVSEVLSQIQLIAPPATFVVEDPQDNSLTNDEVEEIFGELLTSGDVVVIAMRTDNIKEGWVDCYFAQTREIARAKRLSGGNGGAKGMSALTIALKNFDTNLILRHRDTLSTEATAGMTVGTRIKGALISIYDAIEPRDDVHAKNPRQSSAEGMVYVTEEGDPIYRYTDLEIVEGYEGDFVLDYHVSDTHIDEHVAALETEEEVA